MNDIEDANSIDRQIEVHELSHRYKPFGALVSARV